MPREITLTTKQILNLCEFAGVAIDKDNSCFSDPGEEYLLETEHTIAQNEHGAVAWLTEYPEEGGYPLSGDPHCLKKPEGNLSKILKATMLSSTGAVAGKIDKDGNLTIAEV